MLKRWLHITDITALKKWRTVLRLTRTIQAGCAAGGLELNISMILSQLYWEEQNYTEIPVKIEKAGLDRME